MNVKDDGPLLTAPPGATQDVTQAARDALRKVQEFIEDNQKTFKSALANVDAFSAALARNSERVDHIAAGLETLTGGADGKGGDINEAARSIKALAENLDKRTAELTVGILKLANSGTRTLSTIDKAAKNFDANPSRIIFGGPPPAPAKDTSPAAAKRR